MFGLVAGLIKRRAREAGRQVAVSAGFGLVALALALMGAAGLFVSLFFALEPPLGAARAALSVSGLAFVLALLASTPLWAWRRRTPPPSQDVTLAQLAALAGKTSSGLSPRQIALAVALIALGVAIKAATSPKKNE